MDRTPALARRIARRAALVIAIAATAWWLFADTVSRHTSTPDDSATIRFSHFGTSQDYTLYAEIIASFEHDHPGMKVRQEYVTGLSGHYHTKLRQQILSNTLPDVALIQLGPFRESAAHVADLTNLLPAPTHDIHAATLPVDPTKLDPTGLKAFQVGDRQRALPLSGGSLLIYGNLSCFARAEAWRGEPIPLPGDDWTMADFARTANWLTCDFDGDGRTDQFGFWLPRWVYYLPFLWSFGADVMDETLTDWQLLGPRAEEAFGFYRQLAVTDHVCPRGEEVPQLFQDVGFLTGKVAMCVNGPWFLPFLAETMPADGFFVAPIPTGPGGRVTRITWDGIVLRPNLSPQRRALACKFITHLLSHETQERIARTGRALPARSSCQPAFAAPGEVQRRRFVEAIGYSRTQPAWPGFWQMDRLLNRYVTELVDPSKPITPRAMLERLATEPAIQGEPSVNRKASAP